MPRIASQIENCEFTHIDQKFSGGFGTRVPVSVYTLKINYKNHLILFQNELGNHNVGDITTTISNLNIPSFEITNRSHFSRLFASDKNILKIKCADSTFAHFLQEKIIDTSLEKLSRDNLFEPKIYNEVLDNKMVINTRYPLTFEDKTGVVEPLINLYKGIIDYSN